MQNTQKAFLNRFWNWLRHSFNVFWLMLAAGYLVVMAGQEVYQNYQSHQATEQLQSKLDQALLERDRLQALLVYYSTDSFKEKELRRTLLMKKPGETVYALPYSNNASSPEDEVALDASGQNTNKNQNTAASSDPIWRQWIEYFNK